MRNNRGIRAAQRKGELWDLDALGPRGTRTCMLISPFSCSPLDRQVLLSHWLCKSSTDGKGWLCATVSCPSVKGRRPEQDVRQDSQLRDVLGDTPAEGWLHPRKHKPWRQTPEDIPNMVEWQKLSLQTAALRIPKTKCTKPLPHTVSKSLGLAAASSLRAYSLARSAFIRPHLKTLKECRFFIVCMWVKTGQSTGKHYRPKTKAQAQKEVKKHQAYGRRCCTNPKYLEQKGGGEEGFFHIVIFQGRAVWV